MYGEPPTEDLLSAVTRFIEEGCAPSLTGRDAFLARVAVNVLGIVSREMSEGPAAERIEREALALILGTAPDRDLTSLRREACTAFREGRIDASTPGVLTALEQAAVARLRIEQPGYASLTRASTAVS